MLATSRHAATTPSRGCPGRDSPVVTNRQWLFDAVLLADVTRPQALRRAMAAPAGWTAKPVVLTFAHDSP
jgi:hypothetical protein